MIVYKVTNSSAIQTLMYDKQTKELSVIFTDGREQTYLDVPEKVFDELLEAKSAGLYFNISIRPIYKEK